MVGGRVTEGGDQEAERTVDADGAAGVWSLAVAEVAALPQQGRLVLHLEIQHPMTTFSCPSIHHDILLFVVLSNLWTADSMVSCKL